MSPRAPLKDGYYRARSTCRPGAVLAQAVQRQPLPAQAQDGATQELLTGSRSFLDRLPDGA